ncbi:MFS transporter [Streptomyces sp. NPDC053253]|uniref:MFS transporter n=1 Tax=Streptomyces sp. NPDC053253 TaxID=3365699 RepID=UPI0037CCEC8D
MRRGGGPADGGRTPGPGAGRGQLGGRVADLWGRRKAFLTGLIGFALASAAGGAAVDTAMLLGARALQGLFAALLAPAVLSLLSVMFTDPRERAKAFGVFAAVGCGGGGFGLLLGGVLTEYLNWRWTLFVERPPRPRPRDPQAGQRHRTGEERGVRAG